MFAAFLLAAALASPVQQALSESVVVSMDERNVPNAAMCSGFTVAVRGDVEVIATARHCTHDHVRYVQFHDGDHAAVLSVRRSKFADVAVLYVRPHNRHPVTELVNTVQIGDPYFTLGSSSGDPFSFASLRSRNGNMTIDDSGPLLLFEGPSVYLGDSGAGVFDADGRVCAIVAAVSDPDRPGVVFAAPVSYVSDLIAGRP